MATRHSYNHNGNGRKHRRFQRLSAIRLLHSHQTSKAQRWLWAIAFIGLFFVVASGVAVAGATALYQSYTDELDPAENVIENVSIGPSQIYDRNGEFLYQFLDPLGGLRNPVKLEEISPWMIKATISTEDASFYNNPGINIKGLTRAAYENLFPGVNENFFDGTGGSSITQQLVKNVYIPEEERFERTLSRKLKEVVLALELTKRYEKDQILEWYLNQLYYGNFAYGIEAAAKRYFDKSAMDLNLAESALLAGIPQAPGYYTPTLSENYEAAINRQHQVLDLMVQHGHISAEEAQAAKEQELTFIASDFPLNAPHFVFYVRDSLKRMCERGYLDVPQGTDCETLISTGGLKITTSLNLQLQNRAQTIVQDHISSVENTYNAHNGSLVAIDPETGEILVMVGSRDYWRSDVDGEVNVATRDRSPGSTMKPFTYLTALLQGWSAGTILWDRPIPCPPICNADRGTVQNWNDRYLGPVTMRKALSESMNVPAVRSMIDVGVDNVIDTLHKMGITGLQDRSLYGPSLTIGGGELHLLDLAYAYSVLANNGVMSGMPSVGDLESGEEFPDGYRELDPVAVLHVEDSEGKVLYEFDQPEEKEVVPAAASYIITDILSKEVITWSGLTVGRPAAVKTGTSEKFRDATIAGYTPDIAVAIWVGNSDGTFMRTDSFASGTAGPIWKAFMAAAHEGVSVKNFERPPGLTNLTACVSGRCSSDLAVAGLSRYNPGQVPADVARSGDAPSITTPGPSQSNNDRGQQNSNSNQGNNNNGSQNNDNERGNNRGNDDDDDDD